MTRQVTWIEEPTKQFPEGSECPLHKRVHSSHGWYVCIDSTLRTSETWAAMLGAEVLDPDGWDRRNFIYSWHEELISREEFDRRFTRSTVKHDGTNYRPPLYNKDRLLILGCSNREPHAPHEHVVQKRTHGARYRCLGV